MGRGHDDPPVMRTRAYSEMLYVYADSQDGSGGPRQLSWPVNGGSSQGGHQRSQRSTAGAVHAVAFAARVAALAHMRRSVGRSVGFADQAAAASRAWIDRSEFA